MAGAMRKAMVYLGLVEDEDRLEYDDYDQYERDGEADEAGHHDDRHDARASGGSADGSRALSASREGSSVATMPGRRPQPCTGRWIASPRSTRAPTTRPSRSARASAKARR